MRRLAPVFGLFLLSPLVAEFLLGNLPITMLFALVVLAPLYGGGALLVRECARRLGRGWPTMALFAVAYGVVEEGLTTFSLFNPDYANAHLMDSGYVPALGIAIPWTIAVLTLHAVWSISVPIAVVETFVPGRRTTPWLGRTGLIVTCAVFAFGIAGSIASTESMWAYTPSAGQVAGSLVVIAALVAAGLYAGHGTRAPRPGRAVPHPLVVGAGSLVACFAARSIPDGWGPVPTVAAALVLVLGAVSAIRYWSASPAWDARHHLAAAAGALGAYAIVSFPQTPVIPTAPAVDLTGNAIFTAGAIVVVALAARRLHRTPAPAPAPAPHPAP